MTNHDKLLLQIPYPIDLQKYRYKYQFGIQNTRLPTVTNNNTEGFKCCTQLRHKNVLVDPACNGRDQLISESDGKTLLQNSADSHAASIHDKWRSHGRVWG